MFGTGQLKKFMI